MEVELAQIQDIDEIMEIFECAKKFMRSQGNMTQWNSGYPEREFMIEEITNRHCHIIIANSEIVATFCLIPGIDPTYSIINGAWINESPYATIHRLASNGKAKGIGKECIDLAYAKYRNLRGDTHKDNTIMQHIFEINGFKRCGIIHIKDGTPRIAYQKI